MNNKIVAVILFVLGLFLVLQVIQISDDVQHNRVENEEVFISSGFVNTLDATFHDRELIGTVQTMEFTSDGEVFAVGISTDNKLKIYTFSYELQCLEPLVPQISVTGLGNVFAVDFSDDDSYLIAGHTTAPYIKSYDVDDIDFNAFVDVDLTVDNTVLDVKFFNDDYLIVGGEFTNYLQMFKIVNGDFTTLTENIDILPTDVVTDIDYNNGYLFITTLASPYIIVYKQVGDDLVKLVDPVDLPTGSAYVVDSTDNSNYVLVGHEGSPYIQVYKFENELLTSVNIDAIPTQTVKTIAGLFIDNTFFYVGGDLNVYKYKLIDDEFIRQINDLTTYSVPVNVMDSRITLGGILIGDNDGFNCFRVDLDVDFDNIFLEYYPVKINSVKQNYVSKDYTLIGDVLIVTDEVYNQDVIVNYDYLEYEENVIIDLLPLLAVLGLIGSVVYFIRKR